jgi:hypothetical protein
MTFKLKILTVLICFFLSSCFSNRLISNSQKEYKINIDNVNYKLTKAAGNSFVNNGGGGYLKIKNYETKEKGKFYLIEIDIHNLSNSEKIIELNEISLCNDKKECLKPLKIHVKSLVDIPAKDKLELDSNKKAGRELIYAAPDNFNPKYILFNQENNEFIEFNYKN